MADRTQERALSRHIRSGHHEEPRRESEPGIVSDRARVGNERMAEPLRIEADAVFMNYGVGVIGVLERISRERQEPVELSDGIEPAGNVLSVSLPPGLDRECELCPPQHRGGDQNEELIASRIEIVDEAAEPANSRRSLLTLKRQRFLEPQKSRGFESLGLESLEERRQDRELSRRLLHGGQHLGGPLAQDHGNRRRDDEKRQQRQPAPPGSEPTNPGDHGHDAEREQ